MKKGTINLSLSVLCLYIITIMSSDSTGDLIVKMMRILTFGILTISLLTSKKKIEEGYVKKRFYLVWCIAFLSFCICSIKWATNKDVSIQYCFSLMYILIINFLTYLYLRKNKVEIKYIVNSIITGATLKGFICFITNGILVFLNSRSANISANTIGFYSAIASILCIYNILKNIELKKSNLFNYIIFIINIIFMLLSASRKSIVFFMVPFVLIYILKNKNPGNVIKNIFLICIVCFLVFTIFMKVEFFYNLLGKRIETMINGIFSTGDEVDASTKTRLQLIDRGIEMYKKNPILGYGIANYSSVTDSYGYYAHNNYVELLVGVGIIGTCIYYSLHVNILLFYIKKLKNISLIELLMFGIIVALVICDYGIVSYYEFLNQLLLFLGYYIIEVYGFNSKNMLLKNLK